MNEKILRSSHEDSGQFKICTPISLTGCLFSKRELNVSKQGSTFNI